MHHDQTSIYSEARVINEFGLAVEVEKRSVAIVWNEIGSFEW